MVRLTDMQEKFCENIAIYGFKPVDAAREAGYAAHCRAVWHKIANRLLSDIHIRSRIAEIREEYFDVDKVRSSIIREHQLTRVFDITTICEPVIEYDDYGAPFTRIKVKPLDEWPPYARTLVVGWDRYNRPIFKSKEQATRELTRIFGLYKDNMVKEEEDTGSVLESAGLSLPNGVDKAVDKAFDEFDADALDRELADEEEEPSDDDAYDFYD